MAYAVIYGANKINNQREVLATIPDIKYNITRRVFDLGTGDIEGRNHNNISINNPVLYTLHEEDGTKIYHGFIKNYDDTNNIKFNSLDLRKVLDTSVLLDFSQGNEDIRLSAIFEKVMSIIINRNTYNINIVYSIPEDTRDTQMMGDYSGRYVIVNALDFLKPYLSYFGYYISINYNQNEDTLQFNFEPKNPGFLDIKLNDFSHSKTQNDIKINKTIATIKYKTIEESNEGWGLSDEIEFNNATNKSTFNGDEAPDHNLYPIGWVIKVIQGYDWTLATETEYNASTTNRINKGYKRQVGGRGNKWINAPFDSSRVYTESFTLPSGSCVVNNRAGIEYRDPFGGVSYYICEAGLPATCPSGSPTLNEMKTTVRNEQYDLNTVVRVVYRTDLEICYNPNFIKPIYSGISFYKRIGTIYSPRPNLPEKTFALGLDNEIYEGDAPFEQKMFPENVSIYESEFIADAQFNAIYYLISNRWVENIILKSNNKTPIDLKILELFQDVRVFDKSNMAKKLPVAEINLSNDKYEVKLGFKKTSFTEIIKHDVGGTASITNT